MTAWRYIKGSEKDFEGAPDEATIVTIDDMRRKHFGDVFPVPGAKYWSDLGGKGEWGNGVKGIQFKIIAQREPVATNDNINHPLRYTKGDIECIDAIKAATVGKTGIEAVDVGHVIRYLWRYEEKDGLESVKKAEWYIKHLINELEGK